MHTYTNPAHATSSRHDIFAWCAYVFAVDVFLGPKPFSAPRHIGGGACKSHLEEAMDMYRRFGLGQYIISNMNWLTDADNTARKGLTPKRLLSRALSVVTHIAKRRKRRRV